MPLNRTENYTVYSEEYKDSLSNRKYLKTANILSDIRHNAKVQRFELSNKMLENAKELLRYFEDNWKNKAITPFDYLKEVSIKFQHIVLTFYNYEAGLLGYLHIFENDYHLEIRVIYKEEPVLEDPCCTEFLELIYKVEDIAPGMDKKNYILDSFKNNFIETEIKRMLSVPETQRLIDTLLERFSSSYIESIFLDRIDFDPYLEYGVFKTWILELNFNYYKDLRVMLATALAKNPNDYHRILRIFINRFLQEYLSNNELSKDFIKKLFWEYMEREDLERAREAFNLDSAIDYDILESNMLAEGSLIKINHNGTDFYFCYNENREELGFKSFLL